MAQIINTLLAFISTLTDIVTPIFVFTVCFNSGMSEHPFTVVKTINENRKYYLKTTLLTCLVFPLLVWGILSVLPLAQPFETGTLVFVVCAGAPIVISFVNSAGNKSLYATAGMIIQLLASLIVIPLLLPIMVSNVDIDMGLLVSNLIRTVVIPLTLGFLFTAYLQNIKTKIKPYVAKLQKNTMDIVIYGILITNIPGILSLIGDFAILTGICIVYLGFFLGYLAEKNNPNIAMKETSAFGIGQRNAAIALLIANGNFGNEVVLSTVIVYAIGLYQMKHLAKVLIKQKERKHTQVQPDNS